MTERTLAVSTRTSPLPRYWNRITQVQALSIIVAAALIMLGPTVLSWCVFAIGLGLALRCMRPTTDAAQDLRTLHSTLAFGPDQHTDHAGSIAPLTDAERQTIARLERDFS